jgi:LysR family nitrogen assimilation transcriptional regulator
MDLRQLDYFVRVTELGSFSRAAAVLRVAQPALSRQVRQLEVELKQTLLLRNGRGVTVTEAGRRMLLHARGLLEQATQVRRAMDAIKGMPVGLIALGLPPTLARLLTVPLVNAFRARLPHAQLAVVEVLSSTMLEWLTLGRVDVGVLFNAVPTAGVELRPWLEEPLFLVGPASARRPSGAVTLAGIARYPLVIPRRPNAFRMLVEARLAAIGATPRIALEIDGVLAIRDLVAQGHGYAILSGAALTLISAKDELSAHPITRPMLKIPVSIGVSAHRPASPLQTATVALIKEIGEAVIKSAAGAQ